MSFVLRSIYPVSCLFFYSSFYFDFFATSGDQVGARLLPCRFFSDWLVSNFFGLVELCGDILCVFGLLLFLCSPLLFIILLCGVCVLFYVDGSSAY